MKPLKYLYIYQLFFRMNFSKLIAYRSNFVSSMGTSVAWAVFSVLSMLLLTSRNQVVFGWKRDELLLLTGVYSIYVGLFHVLFSRNLEQISRIAHRGLLDGYLLKPVDLQFYLSCANVNYSGLPRVISAALFVWWLLVRLRFTVTPFVAVQFISYGIFGLTFLYAVWYSFIAITIRYTQLFNLSDLMYHITDTAKYPSEMYREFRYYLTVFLLPLSFVITLPTKSLLQKIDLREVVILIILAVSIFLFSRKFGNFMLRYYTSASS